MLSLLSYSSDTQREGKKWKNVKFSGYRPWWHICGKVFHELQEDNLGQTSGH